MYMFVHVIVGDEAGSGEGMSKSYTIEEYFCSTKGHPAKKHLHVSAEAICSITEIHFHVNSM